MNALKRLAAQTAVYGLSSVIGRFFNFLLVPLYTAQFLPAEYGVVTELYAYIGFANIVLTYGMETALFRFLNDKNQLDKNKVYSSALISHLFSTLAFASVFLLFSAQIADVLQYENQQYFILLIILILAADTLTALPFAKLRADNRPIRFALLKLLNIGVNVGLNLFFVWFCKDAFEQNSDSYFGALYRPEIGVGYIFIANLSASLVTLILLTPEWRSIKWGWSADLWKKMLYYALPLVAVGLAGQVNEMLDRALLKFMLPYSETENLYQLGLYGAAYKLAMFMTIFIQAFRYAADPFFFSQANKKDAKRLYAVVLKYFAVFGCFIFLLVTLYLDYFKAFLRNEQFHEGLGVVPILLLANLFLGIYINLSIWYKLTDRTGLGAIVALVGALITLSLNIWWIPTFGFYGSAWATLICYVCMAVISYLLSLKYFKAPYEPLRILFYIVLAVLTYFVAQQIETELSGGVRVFAVRFVLLIAFLGIFYLLEGRELRSFLIKRET